MLFIAILEIHFYQAKKLLVLIYLIMAILITTFAIIFHQKNGIGIIEYFSKENSLKNYENNNEVIEETSEKEEIDFNDIKRVNLSDTFKYNNLDIKYETYEYDGQIKTYSPTCNGLFAITINPDAKHPITSCNANPRATVIAESTPAVEDK